MAWTPGQQPRMTSTVTAFPRRHAGPPRVRPGRPIFVSAVIDIDEDCPVRLTQMQARGLEALGRLSG
jgi:hypothetical protein